MRVEYQTIVDAGVILQSTTPGYRRYGTASACRWGSTRFGRGAVRIEALNHALRGLPREHALPPVLGQLARAACVRPGAGHLVDLLVRVRARLLIEGANARHEHEWQVWERTRLPADTLLIPGVVPIQPMSSSIQSWSRSGCSASPTWSAAKTSSAAPIAASAAARTRR